MADNSEEEIRKILQNLGRFNEALDDIAVGQKKEAEQAQKVIDNLGLLSRTAVAFGKSMTSASDTAGKYAGAVETASSSVKEFTASMGPLAKGIGVVVDLFSKLAGSVFRQNEALVKSYRGLSQFGELGKPFTEMVDDMQQAGFSLDQSAEQYVKALEQVAPGLATFAGSVDKGSKKLTEVMVHALGNAQFELERFGVTSEEFFKRTGVLMGVLSQSGGMQKKSSLELFNISKDYVETLTVLNSITGQTRDEAERKLQRDANDLRFQMYLDRIQQSGKAGEDMAMNLRIAFAEMDDDMAAGWKSIIANNGDVVDKEGIRILSMFGTDGIKAFTETIKKSGDSFPKAYADFVKEQSPKLKKGFDDAYGTMMVDVNIMKDLGRDMSTYRFMRQGALTDSKEIEDKYTKLRSDAAKNDMNENTARIQKERKVRNAFEQFEFQMSKMLLPMLDAFTTALEALGESMADFAYTFSGHIIDVRDAFKSFKNMSDVTKTLTEQDEKQVKLKKELDALSRTNIQNEKFIAEQEKLRAMNAPYNKEALEKGYEYRKQHQERISDVEGKISASQKVASRAQAAGASMYRPDTQDTGVGEGDLKNLKLKTGAEGAMRPGGKVDPKLVELATKIQSEIEGFLRFTSLDDAAHAFDNNSLHNKGKALDFTLDHFPTEAEGLKLVEALKAMGFNKVLDEYNHPSASAWAKARAKGLSWPPGHFHAELQAKNGGIFSGPVKGYDVKLHGDEAVVPMNKGVTKQPLSSITLAHEIYKFTEMFESILDRLDRLVDVTREGSRYQEEHLRYAKAN